MIRQVFSACLLAAIHSSVLLAADAADPMAGLRACAAQTDDARRLACYDAAMKDSRTAVPATTAAAAAATVSTPTAEDKFGYRGTVAREDLARQAAETPKLEQLNAQVTAIASQPRGEFVVTLSNEQVWVQKTADSHVKLKVGDSVTIKPGALGSFFLVTTTGHSTRVARVR